MSFSPSKVCSLDEAHPEVIFEIKSSCDESMLFSSVSNRSLVILDRPTLSPIVILAGHKDVVHNIEASSLNPSLLFSSSADKTICAWDVRIPGKDACVSCLRCSDEVQAIAVGIEDTLLAAACGNSVLFFDLRMLSSFPSRVKATSKPLYEYSDLHTDAVTQLQFLHPTSSLLASASEDGLICIHDLSISDPEEFTVSTLNIECPIRKFGFFGHNLEGLYCLSTVETMSCWHHKSALRIGNYPRLTGSDYLVDCVYDNATDSLFVVAGDYGGGLKILEVQPDSIKDHFSLQGGHSDIVRSVVSSGWSKTSLSTGSGSPSRSLWTAGEDGRICQWDHL